MGFFADPVQSISDTVSHVGQVVASSPVAQTVISVAGAAMGVPPAVTAAVIGANTATQKDNNLGAGIAAGLGSYGVGNLTNSAIGAFANGGGNAAASYRLTGDPIQDTATLKEMGYSGADAAKIASQGAGAMIAAPTNTMGGVWDGVSQIGKGLGINAGGIIPALGALYSGNNTSEAIKAASNQLQAGGLSAIDTIRQYENPYVVAGGQALDRYSKGIAPGGEFTTNFTMADAQNTPAMKFAQQQGQDIIQNSAAAKGGLLTSNTLEGLTKFGQSNAAQYEAQAFDQWLANRNANLTAVQNLTNIGKGAADTAGTGIGNTQIGMANSLANSTVAGANNAATTTNNAIKAATGGGTPQFSMSDIISGAGQLGSAIGSGVSSAYGALQSLFD